VKLGNVISRICWFGMVIDEASEQLHFYKGEDFMQAIETPNVVPLSRLSELVPVPGRGKNFWYQRSRFDAIPGQFRVGRYVMIDLNVFFPALKAGEIGTLK